MNNTKCPGYLLCEALITLSLVVLFSCNLTRTFVYFYTNYAIVQKKMQIIEQLFAHMNKFLDDGSLPEQSDIDVNYLVTIKEKHVDNQISLFKPYKKITITASWRDCVNKERSIQFVTALPLDQKENVLP